MTEEEKGAPVWGEEPVKQSGEDEGLPGKAASAAGAAAPEMGGTSQVEETAPVEAGEAGPAQEAEESREGLNGPPSSFYLCSIVLPSAVGNQGAEELVQLDLAVGSPLAADAVHLLADLFKTVEGTGILCENLVVVVLQAEAGQIHQPRECGPADPLLHGLGVSYLAAQRADG